MQSWLYTAPVLLAILVWKPKDVFSITCDFNVSSDEFITSEFESSEDCNTSSWVITAPPNQTIRLKFETFQLSDSQEYGQNWIKIYDGRNTNNTSLGVLTGARRPFIIQSSGRFMLVELIKQGLHLTSLCNFKGVCKFDSTKDKPKILISHKFVRAAPGHFVWCSAEGSPPINISIFKNSTFLANRFGLVMAPLKETGIYSCVASNEAGTDTRNLSVTIVDCGNLCFSHGNVTNGQVENKVWCNASSSSVDIFECLPTTATILNITGTEITYLPKEGFRDMASLKLLDLRDNEIKVLPEEVFSDLFSLQELFLSGNNIQDLTENVFSRLVNLQHLDLSHNAIRHLPRRIFAGPSQLRSLSLKWNEIEELPTGLFLNLSKLEELFLSGSNIKNLSENVFSNLVNLKHLDLSQNAIRSLPPRIFTGPSQLRSLYLRWNEIKELPKGLFLNLTKLEELSLGYNKIQDLKTIPFSYQRSLFFLDLESNEIQSLPKEVFSNLRTLKYLFLQKNLIDTMPEETFSNLVNLQYLLLNQNKLLGIGKQAFKNLTSLKIIMLSDNNITTIGSQAFTIPNGRILLIYMIRTVLLNLTLHSFNNVNGLRTDITVDEGRVGTIKFKDADHAVRCRIHLGPEKNNSDYIEISSDSGRMRDILLKAFAQAGFAKKGQDAYQLFPCPTGWYLNSSFNDNTKLECLKCPAGGFFSDTEARVSNGCTECPTGTFVSVEKAPGVKPRDCVACPQGTNTASFAGYRGCRCLEYFYRNNRFGGCIPCEQLKDGLKCENDLGSLKTGYWWDWINGTHEQVYVEFAQNLTGMTYSPGKSINSSITYHSRYEFPYTMPMPHKCQREEACLGGIRSSCVTGYQGPLCEICNAGYYKQFKSCLLCPTKKWMIVELSFLATVVAIVIAVLVWIGKKKSKKREGRSSVDIVLSRLKIVIGCYQVTNGILEAFSYVKWPDSLTLFGKYSEILQLGIFQIAPIHCLMPNLKMNAFKSLFAILALNAAAILMSVLAYVLRKLFLLRTTLNEEQKEKKAAQTKELIYRNLFFFLFVTYLGTCSKTASVLPLACRKLCLDEEEKTCHVYLKADYTIKCEGQEYYRLVIVAYCAISYIIFLPTASLVFLWRQHMGPRGNVIPAENEALEPQEQATEIITGLRFLFETYNSHSWYWELIETVRKVLLTSGLILVGGHSRAFVGLACVMSGLYGITFANLNPIVDPFENKLMLTSLAVTFVNLGIGTVSKIPEERAPDSMYAYMDSPVFKLAVYGVNSSVIGLLVVHYFGYIYHYINEWRKNPQWSFSCCLAMVLPLAELQSEVRGCGGRDSLEQQLLADEIDMSLVPSTLKESGLVTFDLLEEETNLMPKAGKRDKMADSVSEENEENVIWEKNSAFDIYERPRNVEDTWL